MSIADKFWGSQQAQRANVANRVVVEAPVLDFSLFAEAAAVARFKRWTSVTLATGPRGDVVIAGYRPQFVSRSPYNGRRMAEAE